MSLKLISPTYYSRISNAMRFLNSSKDLLDIGCSDGYIHKKLNVKNITGIDINESDLRVARFINPNNKYLKESVYELSFKDSKFDTILCLDVLEHLEDDLKALEEISRVLKKDGMLILTVPSRKYPFLFDPINSILKFFGKYMRIGIWGFGHVRLYTFEDLDKKLKKTGFKVIEKKYISHTFIGLVENGYLINLVQPLVKSSPKNLDDKAKNFEKLKRRLLLEPKKPFLFLRDLCIAIDEKIFGRSKTSINLFLVAKKIK